MWRLDPKEALDRSRQAAPVCTPKMIFSKTVTPALSRSRQRRLAGKKLVMGAKDF